MPGSPGPAEQLACLGLGQAGLLAADLDQYQVRLWHSFHRHTVVSVRLGAARRRRRPPRPAPPGDDPPAGDGPPEAWRDTGKLPATVDDRSPAMTPA